MPYGGDAAEERLICADLVGVAIAHCETKSAEGKQFSNHSFLRTEPI